MSVKKCSKCNADFECRNEEMGCWCENLEIGLETLKQLKKDYDNCLCPLCLKDYSSNTAKK